MTETNTCCTYCLDWCCICESYDCVSQLTDEEDDAMLTQDLDDIEETINGEE